MNRFRLFCSAQAELAAPRKSVLLLTTLLLMTSAIVVVLALREYSDSMALLQSETAPGAEGSEGYVKGMFSQREHLSSFPAALEAMKAAAQAPPLNRLPKGTIVEWYGGKAMDAKPLRRTLEYVTRTLRPDGTWSTSKVLDLMMETAAVETAMGYIVRQQGGPALSVWQILGFNFEEIPEYFGKKDPKLLERAMIFYDPSQTEEWNRVHNIPWTAAMSLLFYEKASKGTFLSRLDTLDSRGRLWKQLYNTHLGKGTVQRYKERAREYVHTDVKTS